MADGTDWMPAVFKGDGPQKAAREEGPQRDAPEDAEARTEELDEAQAA